MLSIRRSHCAHVHLDRTRRAAEREREREEQGKNEREGRPGISCDRAREIDDDAEIFFDYASFMGRFIVISRAAPGCFSSLGLVARSFICVRMVILNIEKGDVYLL